MTPIGIRTSVFGARWLGRPCRCAPRLARAAVLGLWLDTLAWALHAWAEECQGKVIAIADGDTITVLRDRAPAKIRLNGADMPEGGQAFGNRAKQFTADLAFGKVVTVRVRDQ